MPEGAILRSQAAGLFNGTAGTTVTQQLSPTTTSTAVLLWVAITDLTSAVTSVAPSVAGAFDTYFIARVAGSNRRYELWLLRNFKPDPAGPSYVVTWSASQTARVALTVTLDYHGGAEPMPADVTLVGATRAASDTQMTFEPVTPVVGDTVAWFAGWDNTGAQAATGALTNGIVELASAGTTGQRVDAAVRPNAPDVAALSYAQGAFSAAYAWVTQAVRIATPPRPAARPGGLIKGRKTAADDNAGAA